MQDFIPLGTGNSRSLKSSIQAGTTWEQALTMLRNGTFPIDIGAVNESGVTQKGTALNKGTLLSDETSEKFAELPENPVPDDVFYILSKAALYDESNKLILPSGETVSQLTMQVLTGNASSALSSLKFNKKPVLVIIINQNSSGVTGTKIVEFLSPYSSLRVKSTTGTANLNNSYAVFSEDGTISGLTYEGITGIYSAIGFYYS